jgi:sugar lactone lactonase YvrE
LDNSKVFTALIKRLGIITLIAGGTLAQTSCGTQRQGLVMMTDESYTPRIVATSKSGFGSPDGLAWRNGKLYIADEGGDALEQWNASEGLKAIATAQTGFISPEDLVMDREGNIFFTDDDAGGLWEIDTKGVTHLLAGKDKGLISTEGIALATDGSLLVGDGEQHEIFRVKRDGTVSEFLGKSFGINKPESMVFDELGNLYIADNEDQVLYMLDAGHNLHRIIEHRDSFSPETLFYSKGLLYITDSRNGKLFVYRPNEELKIIAAFSGELRNVQGITLDDAGNIYIGVQTDLKRKLGDIIEISKERS